MAYIEFWYLDRLIGLVLAIFDWYLDWFYYTDLATLVDLCAYRWLKEEAEINNPGHSVLLWQTVLEYLVNLHWIRSLPNLMHFRIAILVQDAHGHHRSQRLSRLCEKSVGPENHRWEGRAGNIQRKNKQSF